MREYKFNLKFFALMDVRVWLVLCFPLGTVCWWPFSSSSSENEPTVNEASSGQLRRAVEFEMTTAEQKFLAEAQQFIELSQLDQCQHLVCVVHKIMSV